MKRALTQLDRVRRQARTYALGRLVDRAHPLDFGAQGIALIRNFRCLTVLGVPDVERVLRRTQPLHLLVSRHARVPQRADFGAQLLVRRGEIDLVMSDLRRLDFARAESLHLVK